MRSYLEQIINANLDQKKMENIFPVEAKLGGKVKGISK